ncbi:RIP metalloprotease RseP [Lachnospiraceae bacterium 3-1]|nr:RIP metalloprotease RseP [Lachnospiraceae bacterium 3-1]
MNIIIAIIIFSIIILFHELGHFLLAKFNGIKVNEFCLGMGPTLIGFTKGETKYSIKLLPFGGACMMEGEDGESQDERSFNSKSVWARISVVVAGPVFNFIMAWIFAVIVVGITGYDRPVLSGVMEGFPAEEAGLKAGDEIISMNGYRTHFYREVSQYSLFHPGEDVALVYERDGKRYESTLSPILDEASGRYLVGLSGRPFDRERGNAWDVLKNSVYEVRYWINNTIESLRLLVTGKVGVKDMSGPVGIVKIMGDTYDSSQSQGGTVSAILSMVNFSIFLSANLGIMNLLPIPALDGGRLVFLIIEAIRRKRISPEKEGMVHFVGLMALMALMVLVMFNDIRNIL